MFKKIILIIIEFYQKFISPNFGQNCRFWPTCSEYTHLAVQKYGVLKGGWKGFKRILRCYPWSLGGVDLP